MKLFSHPFGVAILCPLIKGKGYGEEEKKSLPIRFTRFTLRAEACVPRAPPRVKLGLKRVKLAGDERRQ